MHIKLSILTVTSFILAAFCLTLFFLFWPAVENSKVANVDVHTPTNMLRMEWQHIENILNQKDPAAISEINKLLFELVKYENDVTGLLDHKASTQMGCISVVITIVLATFSFLTKDFGGNLSEKRRKMFRFLYIIVIVILMISIYFSYQSFKVRPNYAAYNVDDLFNIMKDKDSGLQTFYVSNILENYQIYNLNGQVNDVKADVVARAAFFFICGIISFFVVLLIMIFSVHGKLLFKKGVEQ